MRHVVHLRKIITDKRRVDTYRVIILEYFDDQLYFLSLLKGGVEVFTFCTDGYVSLAENEARSQFRPLRLQHGKKYPAPYDLS